MSKFKRPPLGIIPKWLWDEKRKYELFETIVRYRVSGRLIPEIWRDELIDLILKNK